MNGNKYPSLDGFPGFPPPQYESNLACCPFYATENTIAIRCSSWNEDLTLIASFRSAAAAKRHKEQYCRSLSGCTDCPIHQMVDFEIAGKEKDPR